MRAGFVEILEEAERRGAAAPAFTCYDLEAAAAVLTAAADRDRAVIILISSASVRAEQGDAFVAAVLAYADRSPARCCVQVDHVESLDLIERVLELGVGAILADGSRRSFEDNVSFVRNAVGLAGATGAGVEAELGRIEGNEDMALAAQAGLLTDPRRAKQFVAESGADCLAISIGNAHGRYSRPPELDWGRLEEIDALLTTPLALHGASGLPDVTVRRAIGLGVRKINFNTELREAYLAATAQAIDAVLPTAALLELHQAQMQAVSETAAAKLHLCDVEGGR